MRISNIPIVITTVCSMLALSANEGATVDGDDCRSRIRGSKAYSVLFARVGADKLIPGPNTYRLFRPEDVQQGILSASLTSDGKGAVALIPQPDSFSMDTLSLADAEEIWGPRSDPDTFSPVVTYGLYSASKKGWFEIDLELKNSNPEKPPYSRNLKVVKYRVRSRVGWSSWIPTKQSKSGPVSQK